MGLSLPVRQLLVAQYNAEKLGKKLLGEDDVEAVLKRLDRLTQEEARATVAQTLEIVHGLVGNMNVIMDGEQTLIVLLPFLLNVRPFGLRRQGIS